MSPSPEPVMTPFPKTVTPFICWQNPHLPLIIRCVNCDHSLRLLAAHTTTFLGRQEDISRRFVKIQLVTCRIPDQCQMHRLSGTPIGEM